MVIKLIWPWQCFSCISLRGKFIMLEVKTCAYGVLSKQSSNRAEDIKLNEKLTKTGHYKDAISALNQLQTNSMTIQLAVKRQIKNLNNSWKYLQRSGIDAERLDQLSVIHVSGTKGKGSTCALTESILQSYGFKTGFFSSPHLVSVTERIRINGHAISEEKFTKYFWKIYNRLDLKKDYENDMPAYFQFMTILSFHVFFDEKVDVAIYEVGIGGEKDCTNVLRTTKTVGITSLGLEHTSLLGNTLAEIAREKAGIIKPNSNVYTVSQPNECMHVIKQVANERNAKVFIVPDFSSYKFPRKPKLQIQSKVQPLNASLAVQLAYDWLERNHITRLNGLARRSETSKFILEGTKEVVDGLENCVWLGRCQITRINNKTIHLDGAHTRESLDVCADWFFKQTQNNLKPKCLIFNATGDRNSEHLMSVLTNQIDFDAALFVPNIAFYSENENETSDVICFASSEQVTRAQDHARLWSKLQNSPIVASFSCIFDALLFLDEKYSSKEIDVLITGSLNLVGSSLVALEKYAAKRNC